MNTQDKNMVIESFAKGREKSLVKRYVADGPSVLKGELELTDSQWKVVFEYLVLNCGLLQKVVTSGLDFFMDGYIKHGFSFVREVLDVEGSEYDEVCREVFDLLAVKNGGLRYHVIENRSAYMTALETRNPKFVRTVLGLSSQKYDEQWEEVLNLLLTGFCDDIFEERNLDRGLGFFTKLINIGREHKSRLFDFERLK